MESLEQLEQNLLQLLNRYQELQLQVNSLQEENQRQREEIIQTHADIQQLKRDYNKLHTAHTMLLASEATAEDRAKAKQKITNIILQIDKALEALTQ
jgi:FtsZ-binding cell division protein ZapB